jgi:hypothetical protein
MSKIRFYLEGIKVAAMVYPKVFMAGAVVLAVCIVAVFCC